MTTNSTRSRQVFVAVVVLVTALMLSGSAQAQPCDEAIWQQFLEWLPSAPPVDGPNILFNQYRSRLISNGASTTEADRQMDIVRRMHRERPDAWRIMFKNIYSSSTRDSRRSRMRYSYRPLKASRSTPITVAPIALGLAFRLKPVQCLDRLFSCDIHRLVTCLLHQRDGFWHNLRPNQGTQTVPTEGEMHRRV